MADDPRPQDPPPARPQDPAPGRAATPRVPWGPVVATLIVANLAMFALELGSGVDPFNPQVDKVVELGANFAPKTLHGEPWRLFTSMFLHFGLLHLAMNMVFLYSFRVVEQHYGSVRFAAIYLVAGLTGSIASVARVSNVASAGASGALFGVFGAFFVFLWLRKDRLPAEQVQKTMRSLGTLFALNIIYGLRYPGIDMAAHIGGLVGGAAASAALLYGDNADAQRTRRAIGVTIGGLALVAVALFALSKRSDYTTLLFEFDKVQPATIQQFNDLVGERQSGKITDAQMADAIENQVLPPWQALRKKLDDTTGVPDEIRVVYNKITRFMELRETAWLARIAVLRDPTNIEKLEKAAGRDAEADAAVRELNETMLMEKAKADSR